MLRFIVFLVFSLSVLHVTHAQSERKIYTVKELQEDFNFWRDRLEAKSPLLYFYDNKPAVDNYLDSIYARIDHPMTDFEFYNLIAPATSFVKDVHSGVQPSSSMKKYILEQENLFPLDVVWINNAAYVAISDSSSQIKRGTQLLSINDIDIKKIFDHGWERMPNDGYSQAHSRYLVNAYFWMTYHRTFGQSDSYKVEYINEKGMKVSTSLNGVNREVLSGMRAGSNRPMFKDETPLITLKIDDSLRLATLTIRTFDDQLIKRADQDRFKKSIKMAFRQIHASNVERLIIDIRGNEGGDPMNSKVLLKNVLNSTFHISLELRKVKHGDKASFENRTKKVWLPAFGLGTFRPKRNNFSGEIVVLINGGTSSAAGEFSGIMRKHKRAQFVGTETGGNPILLSGSITSNLSLLPNTKIKSFVGTLCSVNANLETNTGYGLQPDHEVNITPEDLLNFKDPQFQFALTLFRAL